MFSNLVETIHTVPALGLESRWAARSVNHGSITPFLCHNDPRQG